MALNATDRMVNLLGALALGVSDRMRRAVAEAVPFGGETAAAVNVIGHAPTMSIDQLSRVLRLSHAGTVRLVDRLVESGFVEKRPSAVDRRVMCLALTTDGMHQRHKLLALRSAALATLFDQVTAEDLAAFERVDETIAGSLPENALTALTTCRFCDERHCTDCPMEVFGTLEPAGGPVTGLRS